MDSFFPIGVDLSPVLNRLAELEASDEPVRGGLVICLKRVLLENVWMLANKRNGDEGTDINGDIVLWSDEIAAEVSVEIADLKVKIAELS